MLDRVPLGVINRLILALRPSPVVLAAAVFGLAIAVHLFVAVAPVNKENVQS